MNNSVHGQRANALHYFFNSSLYTRSGIFIDEIMPVNYEVELIELPDYIPSHTLDKDMIDGELFAIFGNKDVFVDGYEFCTILYTMIHRWSTIAQPVNKRTLLSNGGMNIFHVQGRNDNVISIGIHFYDFLHVWLLRAFPLFELEWTKGDRFFSCKNFYK